MKVYSALHKLACKTISRQFQSFLWKMGSCCGKPETDFSRHKTCRRPSAEKGGSKIDLPEDDDSTISIEPRYVIYRPAAEHRGTRLKPQLQANRGPTTDISPYAEQRYKDGLEYARKATQYDQHGNFSVAVAFYNEAVEALSQACTMAPVFAPSMDQVMDYRRRAEEIRQYLSTTKAKPPAPAASGQKDKVSWRSQTTHSGEGLVTILYALCTPAEILQSNQIAEHTIATY